MYPSQLVLWDIVALLLCIVKSIELSLCVIWPFIFPLTHLLANVLSLAFLLWSCPVSFVWVFWSYTDYNLCQWLQHVSSGIRHVLDDRGRYCCCTPTGLGVFTGAITVYCSSSLSLIFNLPFLAG